MPEKKHLIWLWRLFCLVLAGTALWAGVRFALPLLLPFLLGLGLARLMERPVRWLMERLRLPRVLAAGLMTLLLAGLLVGLLVWLGLLLLTELNRLVAALPELMTRLPTRLGGLMDRVEVWIAAAPLSMQELLRSVVDGAVSGGAAIPGQLYTWLAGVLAGVAAGFPRTMLFGTALVLSTFFISGDYPRLTTLLLRPFKEETRQKILKIKEHLTKTLGRWLRAQGIVILITFVLLLLGLLLLREDYALLLAAVTACLDALPIIGVGFVLLPWGLYCLLSGQASRGICLLLLYAVVTLVRGLTEPKLVGHQIGLPPLPTLMALYVGFLLWGIWGMILAPIGVMLVKQMWDWGWLGGKRER